jgi:arylsulfatase A-like enzyme
MTDTIRNVVLVIVDALRRDRVTPYAAGRDLTPHLADLASEGTVFDNAFACTNTTDPSVTSIHTGRDPDTVVKHHGPFVTEKEKQRAESVETVPELLHDAGLSTLVTGRTLGRWHKRGFDHYPEAAVGRYTRRAIGETLERISPRLRTLAGWTYEQMSTLTASNSTDEIDEFLDTIGDNRFYGMIHMMDTHAPYSHDEAVVDELLAQHEYPNRDLEAFFQEHSDNGYVDEFMRGEADAADYRDGLARWFAKYDASVMQADQKIGKLIAGLRAREQLDETAVIVISDHGESLCEHGIYFEHHGLYDPQIRVPMIVAAPGVADARRTELVQLYDLAPTILALAGVDATLDCEGRSLTPLLTGDGVWDGRDNVVVQEAHAQRRLAIRTREFKYIEHTEDDVLERERGDSYRCGYCDTIHGGKRELYDLRSDPAESENVLEEYPDRVADLEAQLTAYFEGLSYPDTGSGRVEYGEEEAVMERLEDLGYR